MKKTLLFSFLFIIATSQLFSQYTDTRTKYRIGFNAPKIDHRQILLTIDANTTDGFDWGYDGEIYQMFNDDMYWLIGDKKFVIQATNTVSVGKEVALGVISVEGGDITIKIDEIANPIEELKVGLIDKQLNITHNLEESDYQVHLEPGEYHERFALTFISTINSGDATDEATTDEATTDEVTTDEVTTDEVTTDEVTTDEATTDEATTDEATTDEATTDEATTDEAESTKLKLVIYINKNNSILNIKNKGQIYLSDVTLYNRLGQSIVQWNQSTNAKNVVLPINVRPGVYIIQVNTEAGRVTKRVNIKNS